MLATSSSTKLMERSVVRGNVGRILESGIFSQDRVRPSVGYVYMGVVGQVVASMVGESRSGLVFMSSVEPVVDVAVVVEPATISVNVEMTRLVISQDVKAEEYSRTVAMVRENHCWTTAQLVSWRLAVQEWLILRAGVYIGGSGVCIDGVYIGGVREVELLNSQKSIRIGVG